MNNSPYITSLPTMEYDVSLQSSAMAAFKAIHLNHDVNWEVADIPTPQSFKDMADSISLGKPTNVGLAEALISSYCNETKQQRRLTLMDQEQIFDTLCAAQNPSLSKNTIDTLATHLSNQISWHLDSIGQNNSISGEESLDERNRLHEMNKWFSESYDMLIPLTGAAFTNQNFDPMIVDQINQNVKEASRVYSKQSDSVEFDYSKATRLICSGLIHANTPSQKESIVASFYKNFPEIIYGNEAKSQPNQVPFLSIDLVDRANKTNSSALLEEMNRVYKNEKPEEVQSKRSKTLLATM